MEVTDKVDEENTSFEPDLMENVGEILDEAAEISSDVVGLGGAAAAGMAVSEGISAAKTGEEAVDIADSLAESIDDLTDNVSQEEQTLNSDDMDVLLENELFEDSDKNENSSEDMNISVDDLDLDDIENSLEEDDSQNTQEFSSMEQIELPEYEDVDKSLVNLQDVDNSDGIENPPEDNDVFNMSDIPVKNQEEVVDLGSDDDNFLESFLESEPEITEQNEQIVGETQVPILDEAHIPPVIENSRIISDSTFDVGEIPIDINQSEDKFYENAPHLQDLYNESEKQDSLLNNPVKINMNKSSKGVVFGMVGALAALIIIGVVGFSAFKMLKPAQDDAPLISDSNVSDNKIELPSAENKNTPQINTDNVVKMEPNTSYSSKAKSAQSVNKSAPVSANAPARKIAATEFLEVKKLSWEAPNYVTSDGNFRQYFQSAGKSLKLSLNSDLLLASEYGYSNQARVSINFDQDGKFKGAKILLSSGSNQVDKIVLQTVTQTLTVLNAPHSIGKDQGTTVILKIYF